MKLTLLTTSTILFLGTALSAQIGINTTTPQTTLDVNAKRDSGGNITDNTQLIGLQAPRLTRAELTANTATYGTNQQGALIYITDVSGGTATGQRINIDAVGYYSFDGSLWQKIKVTDTNIYNNNGTLTSTRTLTQAGFPLTFTNVQKTTFSNSSGVGINQDSGTGSRSSIGLANGGTNQLWLYSDTNSATQISATNTATSLSILTSNTATSAPIVFSTNTGGATGSERMRITGDGNIAVNTSSPTEKLDVNGNTRLRSLPLNGATNAIYTTSAGAASATQNQTFTATRTVVSDANGVLGYVTGVPIIQSSTADATRYLGGTVYVRFNTTSGGTLANARVIGGANGVSYPIGTVSATSSKGGINSVIGNGYTISNPAAGIFDIKFDTALTNIYGISVNIVDAYGSGPSTIVDPDPSTPGNPLFTNDNTQVSFISNSIIRVKTGNSAGDLSNRSFTFLVTGK